MKKISNINLTLLSIFLSRSLSLLHSLFLFTSLSIVEYFLEKKGRLVYVFFEVNGYANVNFNCVGFIYNFNLVCICYTINYYDCSFT